MKIAYVTTYDSRTLTGFNEWSGLGYYISQSLKNSDVDLEYLCPLQESEIAKIVQKCKRQYYKRIEGKHYEKDADLTVARDYARQIATKLAKTNADIVFSATMRPISYLECQQPIVFWADATCAGIADFYPQYQNMCRESLDNWHRMERISLDKCKLAIYASDWAAQTAIEYYGADRSKVKVVPFGANLDSHRDEHQIRETIAARPTNRCKLLFLGVDWNRKGGDVAFAVAERLNQSGLETELTVIGCNPLIDGEIPDFVKPLGFISKSTPEGKAKIDRALAESHFLIVPSLAECYGLVFCEANSLGVPCLSRKVGGIPTIVKQNINGKLFPLDADISEYCDYIESLFTNYRDYQELAFNSFQEYKHRLNWEVAGRKVKELLDSIC